MPITLSIRKRGAAILSAGAVIALAGCGGHAAQSAAGVASLPAAQGQSPASSASSASSTGSASSAGNGGPAGLTGVTMPDNATPAEQNRIENAWASCMQAHGDHDFAGKENNGAGTIEEPTAPASRYPVAVKACASLQPHEPWQQMPQYNPNYNQDFAKWVNCLNAKGVPVKATTGGWTFNGTSRLSFTQQKNVIAECEMQAFNEN